MVPNQPMLNVIYFRIYNVYWLYSLFFILFSWYIRAVASFQFLMEGGKSFDQSK